MSENCNNTCSTCSEECSSRTEKQTNFRVLPHKLSNIKKVIGIVSGKGGVGKSLVSSLLAVGMNRLGYKVGILDADITGPSIPKAFGINKKAKSNENGLYPIKSSTGIDIMSINLFLENETDPVIWRGPIIGNVVKQFWSDVIWEDVDYIFVDMPPGTGDVALTVFQSLPIEGIIVVTSPQELVSMIVMKAVKMAGKMNVPILGLVENMSYFTCPDNGKDYQIFGDSKIEEIASENNLDVLARIPIDPNIANSIDAGSVEQLPHEFIENLGRKIEEKVKL